MKKLIDDSESPYSVPDRFEQARIDLETLINNNEAKAAAGVWGNYRVSIMTFYISNIVPETGDPIMKDGINIFRVFKGTTLVIAEE